MNWKDLLPDKTWTLFLDRDGVINQRPPGDYIKEWGNFSFLPGVLTALKILSERFGRIIVITNQQGIGKRLMTHDDLSEIHRRMKSVVAEHGSRIDAVYYCPDLATKPDNCRKPSSYMALQAKKDFPEINFSKSIMIGDTMSDMEFASNLGMRTIFINTNNRDIKRAKYDFLFPDLLSFARTLDA